MSVNPGFGGQSFIESQVQKIRDLRRMCDEKGLDPWIEVDGGIKGSNAWKVIEAGANAIVSGSGVFNQPDYAEAIKASQQQQQGSRSCLIGRPSTQHHKPGRPCRAFFVITSSKNQALGQFHHLQRIGSHSDTNKSPIIKG